MENGENEAFSRAVQTAGMILVNMFEKYKGNERAEKRVEEILAAHNSSVLSGEKSEIEAKILVLLNSSHAKNNYEKQILPLLFSPQTAEAIASSH